MIFRIFLSGLIASISLASSAEAGCYVDYKAKQDDPLRLAYGVAEINGACTVADASNELAPRLAQGGWTLLTILGTFDESGLEERQSSAGDHYLSF